MRLGVKSAFIVLMLLLLCIPLLFIGFLVDEREGLLRTATREIGDSFGSDQNILAPVIMLTYDAINKREGQPEIRYRYIIPETVNLTGELDTDIKKRSIYTIPVYSGSFKMSAKFVIPEMLTEFTAVDTKYVLSKNALIGFGISDMKGLKTFPTFKINDLEEVQPSGIINSRSFVFLGIPLSFNEGDTITVEAGLELNGTKEIAFTATGRDNEISLTGDWGDPSFKGYILPDERTVSPEEFTAKWQTTSLARSTFNNQFYMPESYYSMESESFGLSLLNPVDNYSLVERAVKYGFLVVLTTFFVIFMLEILLKFRFHLIQYGFTGLALVVFFLLLLSVSEYLGFTIAYIIASLAQIVLITIYIFAVFKRKATIIFTTFLTVLLAFIYTLLNLNEYALLIGSVFVFAVLAAGMLATRKVDWTQI
jgi:inner membrane protein